jgi:putative nucleotidyltransferase with HDIG domain
VPGSWLHLTARFFDVVSSRRLSDAEREGVARLLREEEVDLFHAQNAADQRHGLNAARSAAALASDRPELVRAALLHDIGKRHAGLGAIGRVFASISIRLRLPLTARFRRYRDHGPLGAAELARCGAEQLVVDFARSHHAARPGSIDPAAWSVLRAADSATVPLFGSRTRYAGGSRRAGSK